MSAKNKPGSSMLWDEILKAIVDAMPEQLFPLFKEVYGKEYPDGTPITLLATESSTYREAPNAPPGSRLSDIALLVNGTDYYHLECQMRNDREMVIRMVAYDLHFAMQYTIHEADENGGYTMHFPRSAVIYPEKNEKLPEYLRCRIIFQDETEHIYEIPTVRIQSYSLQEIHEKHLNLFIPYVLLRLRPKLDPERKFPLEKKELTDFVDKVMIILENELEEGYLTQLEYDDYINLFRRAAEKILEIHADFRKEVDLMTKPMIELPSVLQKRLYDEIDSLNANKKTLIADNEALAADRDALIADKDALAADRDALIADKDALIADKDALIADKDALIADKDALIADKDALIAKNNTLTAGLAEKNALLADKDAELARMRTLLEQYHIPVTA